ncbi:related to C6 finger domain protein [Cephalotrichum gorgonifer]|uniref:Related to C6 finger domain protein n=1 Tax=Cephalotrichum gorgonifer TaxID=2041049 RepID=A0AAE8MSP4_9PEZI|nr:related to C6 finger domain protein [Cephalotrichum gorgonifer]
MAALSPTTTPNGVATNGGDLSMSPRQSAIPKNVAFELLFTDSPQYRARLPMRVQIYPHDTTDSIVTTVKNFYGLYSSPTCSKGISFEDQQGNTLIARYENFRNNMVVYVRVIEEPAQNPAGFGSHPYQPTGLDTQPYYNGENYPLQAPPSFDHEHSRSDSRASRRRSPSTGSARGRRSASTSTNPVPGTTGRSRSKKNRSAGNQTAADAREGSTGYSSGDGAPGSSSGRMKEQIGNTEISLENIVEGGRRKRAKFESSELPLFAPPQMPAATSNPSVSPARRMDQHRSSLSYLPGAANPFSNPRPLPSPQGYSNGYGQGMYSTPEGHRSRGSIGYSGNGIGIHNGASGILPTPDPTVGSVVSEEDKDVAIQLMRLGDMSNISHGRTSASTLDETFSGRADVASSTGATSDGDSDSGDDMPPSRRQKLNSGAGVPAFDHPGAHYTPSRGPVSTATNAVEYVESGAMGDMAAPPKVQGGIQGPAMPKTANGSKPVKAPKSAKAGARPPSNAKAKKGVAANGTPMSPASLPPSRKPSISGANPLLASVEEEHPDLSSKPRCQRCRKSKKGCDRQRPCGRCKDAGLSADQCVSEDEGNGRKGRYGRHMGVPVKQVEMPAPPQPSLLPAAPITATTVSTLLDKSKKRKR